MSYQSHTGGRSYNFGKNIDEVITLLDKIDEVIALSQKNCLSYIFFNKQFTKPIISYYYPSILNLLVAAGDDIDKAIIQYVILSV